jgi:hypothetical protein
MRTRFIFPLVLYGTIYSALHFVLTLLVAVLQVDTVHRLFLLPFAWLQEPLWNNWLVPFLGRSAVGLSFVDSHLLADFAFGGALLSNSAVCGFSAVACFLFFRRGCNRTPSWAGSLSLGR